MACFAFPAGQLARPPAAEDGSRGRPFNCLLRTKMFDTLFAMDVSSWLNLDSEQALNCLLQDNLQVLLLPKKAPKEKRV
jgi:hypothetical protein